jgi:hypothetical protein
MFRLFFGSCGLLSIVCFERIERHTDIFHGVLT